MSFRVDRQTINDLGIFGRLRERSVYGLFNRTATSGGSLLLESMFKNPLSDEIEINRRSNIIRFFQEINISFPFRGDLFDTVEFYLSNTDNRTRLSAHEYTLERRFKSVMGSDSEYEILHKGVLAMTEILCSTKNFIKRLETFEISPFYQSEVDSIKDVLSHERLQSSLNESTFRKYAYPKVASYDQEYRYTLRSELKQLLLHIYYLDVYISVASVSSNRGFVAAKALPVDDNRLEMNGIYHPLLQKAVPNSINIDGKNNVVFLTGANMAGKSTFMKSFGIAIYLAHMGFPVPASEFSFSVQDGMFTTINLADNINIGYSHFYSEVMRVKKVAESLGDKKFIIIFDELFRGTNVKDAYDATIAVTEAFATKRNCIFIISTHIIEAGSTLKSLCDNIYFVNLPTVMENGIPKYTYRITEGITSDRHGMIIINNEGILDILKNRKK